MFNIIKSEVENAPLLTVYSILTLAVYGFVVLSDTLKSLSSSSVENVFTLSGSSSADITSSFVISKLGIYFFTDSLISYSINPNVTISFWSNMNWYNLVPKSGK